MSDKLVAIRIKNNDGTYSSQIPIWTTADNVAYSNNYTISDVLGAINISSYGTVGEQLNTLRLAIGSPLTATTSSQMTDTTKIYVYTGTTSGNYINGHWYYYNGSAWIDGGVYQSTGLQTDKTLTVTNAAADAKVVGDEITDLKSAVNDIAETANNKLDLSKVIDGKLLNTDGETFSDNANYDVTHFFDVEEGVKYTFKGSGAANCAFYYNNNGSLSPCQFVGFPTKARTPELFVANENIEWFIKPDATVTDYSFTIPTGFIDVDGHRIVAFRFCFSKSNIDVSYFCEGDKLITETSIKAKVPYIDESIDEILEMLNSISSNAITSSKRTIQSNVEGWNDLNIIPNNTIVSYFNYTPFHAPTTNFTGVVISYTNNPATTGIAAQIAISNNSKTYHRIKWQSIWKEWIEINKHEKNEEVYYVGFPDEPNNYATVTAALYAMSQNGGTLHIAGGTYDLLEEMGGNTWIQSANSAASYYDCLPWLYGKTKIIGHGYVNLKLELPEGTYASYPNAAIYACVLNAANDFHLENVTLTMKNARYAIHLENGSDPANYNTTFVLKNCILNVTGKESDSVLLYGCNIGCGLAKGCGLVLDNVYVHNNNILGMYLHNRGSSNGGRIVIKDSVFDCNLDSDKWAIKLNSNFYSDPINVDIINSYIDTRILLDADDKSQNNKNVFKINRLNSEGYYTSLATGMTSSLAPTTYKSTT